MENFVKRIMPECSCPTGNFPGQAVVFVEVEQFDKLFVKNIRKRGRAGKHFEFFLLDTLKTTFLIENLTERLTQSEPFCSKSEHCFRCSKQAGETSPLPLVARLWVRLNMHQNPWICLNTLENAWINCSDYARALNMHGHLTCSTGIWRCLRFYISQFSEYDTFVYARVTQNSEYVWLWVETPQ